MARAHAFARTLVLSRVVTFVLAGTAADGTPQVTSDRNIPQRPQGTVVQPDYEDYVRKYAGGFVPQGVSGPGYGQFIDNYAGGLAAQALHVAQDPQSESGSQEYMQSPNYHESNLAAQAPLGSDGAPSYMQFMNRYAGNFAAQNPQGAHGAQGAPGANAPSYMQFMDGYAGGYASNYMSNFAGTAQSGSQGAQSVQNSSYMQFMGKYAGGYVPSGTSGASSSQGSTGYQQYMDKYAGGANGYQQYMGGSSASGASGYQQYMGGFAGGQSSPGAPALNSSTPAKIPAKGPAAQKGFAKYMARYLPKGDNDAYTSKWTSQWSNMSAPYEGMHSGGNSGYDQYVDKYSAMAGKDVSSPGSWQEKAKSQKEAFAKAIGAGGNATGAEALMVAAEMVANPKPTTEVEPMAASALASRSAFRQQLQLFGWVVLGLSLPGALGFAGRLWCRPQQVEPDSLRYLQLV